MVFFDWKEIEVFGILFFIKNNLYKGDIDKGYGVIDNVFVIKMWVFECEFLDFIYKLERIIIYLLLVFYYGIIEK